MAEWRPPFTDARELWLQCDWLLADTPENERHGLTVDLLADLTATLAHGRNYRDDGTGKLARAALRLWQRCQTASKEFPQLLETGREIVRNYNTVPNPGKYPVPLNKALRLWLPKKRPADRMHLLREFLCEHSKFTTNSEGEPEERDADSALEVANLHIAFRRKHGYDKTAYKHYFHRFSNWADERAAKLRRIRARKGGEAKAEKTTRCESK